MKRFFNRIFGKHMVYTIETDFKGYESILWSIKRDKCINPDFRIKKEGGDTYVMIMTTTYRGIKTLIDHLYMKEKNYLSNITIYENDDDVDLITKRRRAWL